MTANKPKQNGKRRSREATEPGAQAAVPIESQPPADPAKSARAWSWRDAAILAPIVLVGLVLRLLYLQEVMAEPDFTFPMMDAAYKDAWAKMILTGRWPIESGQPDVGLDASPYLRPPGYPFFLAIVYLLTGTSYLAVRIVQMALGLASAVLMYALGRALFGRAVAAVAAAFMAVYWIFIFFEGEMNEPPLIVFLLLALANLVRTWPAVPATRHFVWPGFCFGFLILLRPETSLIAPFLLAWAWWVMRGNGPTGRRVARLAAFTVTVMAMILPVTARNYIVSGELVPVCTIGGLNLFAGNNPDATGSFPNLDYRELFGVSRTLSHHNFQELLHAHRRNMDDPSLGHADLERYFVSRALAFMRENPMQTLRLAVRKAFLFWGPWEVSSNKMVYFERQDSRFLQYLPGFPLVAGLAWAGLALFLLKARRGAFQRPTRQMAALIVALVAISCLTHMVFFVVARFRVPIIPFLILFAAYALVSIALMVRTARWQQAGIWAAVSVALIAFFSYPLVPYEYERDRYHFQRGIAYGVTGDLERAIDELQRAVDTGSREWWLLSEMGFAYSIAGDFERAIAWYEDSLEVDPTNADARNKYGHALLQLNRIEEGEQQFRLALDYDFTQYEARLNLAGLLSRLQRLDEAEEQYRELLTWHPNSVQGHFEFGLMLSALGRSDEAQTHLRTTTELMPNHAAAWNYLGMELAAQDRLDEALEAYLSALGSSPGYAVVHINIGNLYAHQGHFEEAILHYMEVFSRPYPEGEDSRPFDYEDALAYHGMAYVFAQQGEHDAAIRHSRQAVTIYPRLADAHNFLGYELMQRGDLEEARMHLEEAIAIDPAMTRARNNLGDLLLLLGRPGEALEQYQAVLAIDADNAYAQNALARINEDFPGIEDTPRQPGNVLLFRPARP